MTDLPPTLEELDANIPDLAQAIYEALKEPDFEIEVPNLTDPSYNLPDFDDDTTGGGASEPLTEDDLTTRTVGGAGLFDGLMQSISKHLEKEFKAQRITTSGYAEATIALTGAALGNAVQFLLGRDQAYWQSRLIKMQARSAEIAVVGARVEIAKLKVELQKTVLEAKTFAANLALAKAKLATEEAQYDQLVAQRLHTEKQTLHVMAQTELVGTEADKGAFEIEYILPLQKIALEKQNTHTEAQTGHVGAQTANVTYQTANVLPAQKMGLDKDNAIKTYNLEQVMPLQKAGLEFDNEAKEFNNVQILPETLKNLKETTESNRAKTLSTRSDGVTPVAGAIGKQMELQDQQITSYKRDAETKVVKILADTWTVQKSMDEGLTPPDSFTDAKINEAFLKLARNVEVIAPTGP